MNRARWYVKLVLKRIVESYREMALVQGDQIDGMGHRNVNEYLAIGIFCARGLGIRSRQNMEGYNSDI